MSRPFLSLPASTLDYRQLAKEKLPRFMFDYIDGGANDELTLHRNHTAFHDIEIRQRVLRDVSRIDTSTTVLGQPLSFPLSLAPVGMSGLYARRGEVQGALAAKNKGVAFTLSTVGICSVEEVSERTQHPFWFQLYMVRDRNAVRRLLERAQHVGCKTLVFTVDLPVAGMRHRDTRNAMSAATFKGQVSKAIQLAARPSWIWDVGIMGRPHQFGNISEMVEDSGDLNSYRVWLDTQFDTSVTWKDIEWLRSVWPGKLVIKGIQEVDEAQEAVNVGADGIVVSNHGGRQLDTVAPTIYKLPPIADAVGKKLDILMDGGVRSGLDVYKALALGAKTVLVGRPWVWSLAAGGQIAIENLLGTLQRELEVTMILGGLNRVEDITREALDITPGSRLDRLLNRS